ncbi:MAG TPA: hypothetical protein VIL94_00910, partial [Acidothermaceae bacterium]
MRTTTMPGRRVAVAVVVLAVVGGCASKTQRGQVATHSSVIATESPVVASSASTSPSPPPVGATAAALAHDHWSALPPAPLAARTEMAGAWSGHQFVVWGGMGGANRDQLFGDGAAYDPATQTWTTLPAAPISARSAVAGVWTGSQLFIWGGYTQLTDNAQRAAADGALYDPATRVWRKLPPGPLSARADAQAFWLGGKVIVLGGHPAVTSATLYSNVDVAMFDPATNTWSKATAMPTNKDQSVVVIAAAATNDRVYVWREWGHWVDNGDNSTSTTWGIESLVFDPATSTWLAGPPQSPSAPAGFTAAVWTGDAIYVPDNDYWCGGCSGPARLGGPGHVLDPRTNTWTMMPAGPVDSLRPSALWTGGALLAFNTTTEMS